MSEREQVPAEVPVLIVGGGAAGLTASMQLATLGIDCLLVERHSATSHLPKAHILNQRTMEIFTELGVADEIYARGCPRELMSTVAWATSLAGPRPEHGRRIGRVDSWGGGSLVPAYDAASPCWTTNLPQIRLEPLLRERAEELSPGRVRFDHEVDAIEPDAGGDVRATVVDRRTGERSVVRATYLIGADAGRTVGPAVGIQHDGLFDMVDMVNAHFTADLSDHIDDPTALITFLINPDGDGGSGVLIKMGPEHWDQRSEEWVFSAMVPSGTATAHDEGWMIDLIRSSLGLPGLEPKIHVVSRWRLEATLADRYRVGRVFVVGDAAHKHSPTTGLGLNSAVQDVNNLCWKIAAVLTGQAGDHLLDTYEAERRPVARDNIERASSAFFRHLNIARAIGLEPGRTREEAWACFTRLFATGADAEAHRARVAAAIAEECHEFAAHNTEIGYTYTSSAVVQDATVPLPGANAVIDFRPSTYPGHRMPHAWLTCGEERRSTYALTGRGRWTLIVDVDAGSAWATAAPRVAGALGLPLDVLPIGVGCWTDADGAWAAQREVSASGAVLIRPDQHIGWRSATMVPDPASALERALRYMTGRPSPFSAHR